MNRLTSIDCVAIPLLLFWVTATSHGQDTITLNRPGRRDSKLLGNITSVSPTEIVVQTSGSERTVPVNEVERIGLSDEPTELRQARAAVMAGQYEQAIESLNDVDLPASASAVLRQEVGFYRVYAQAQMALLGGGDLSEAEQAMKAFVIKERTTFHFFELAETLGDVAKAAGDHENAARYYRQLAKAPWPVYASRSHILMGSALRAQEKWAEAIEEFELVLASPASDEIAIRQQTLARIGRAACQAEMGESQTAIDELQDIIAKNDADDDVLFTQAYLALGSAYRSADKPVDAVLSYLHVDLLFYQQREAHAEALYYLTQLWPKIEQPARGIDARQLLRTRYAGSIWAQRAG